MRAAVRWGGKRGQKFSNFYSSIKNYALTFTDGGRFCIFN
jgi:hypothetical protein